MKKFLVVLTAVVVVVGCEGESTALVRAPKETPEGWTEYDRPEYGFSIAAPDNWTLRRPGLLGDMPSIDLGAMGNGEAPVVSEPKNEAHPEDLAKQVERGVGLVLYNKNIRPLPGEELCRIEIKKEDVGAITAKGALEKGKESLGSDVIVKELQLAVGPCAQLRQDDKSVGGDEITRIMFCLADGKHYWTIYMQSYNNPSELENVADGLIKTFRVK